MDSRLEKPPISYNQKYPTKLPKKYRPRVIIDQEHKNYIAEFVSFTTKGLHVELELIGLIKISISGCPLHTSSLSTG